MKDHLRTLTARRQSWFGLKLPVKKALAQPMLHPCCALSRRGSEV